MDYPNDLSAYFKRLEELANIYADIVKLLDSHEVKYREWDYIHELLICAIDMSSQHRPKHPGTIDFSDRKYPMLCDESVIKYENVVPSGKYPIF